MDWKVDMKVECQKCGESACRVYNTRDDILHYKCFSNCGTYDVYKDEVPDLVDTQPVKYRNNY